MKRLLLTTHAKRNKHNEKKSNIDSKSNYSNYVDDNSNHDSDK